MDKPNPYTDLAMAMIGDHVCSYCGKGFTKEELYDAIGVAKNQRGPHNTPVAHEACYVQHNGPIYADDFQPPCHP